jgi:hypothetical protein
MRVWTAWDPSLDWTILLLAITIAIHVTGIVLIASAIERITAKLPKLDVTHVGTSIISIALIVVVALSLAVLHGIECFVWAVAYLRLGALSSPASAALYSVDSMITRGASGLDLDTHWRMMGAIEGADGVLLFGISTAFLFYAMLRIWGKDEKGNPA